MTVLNIIPWWLNLPLTILALALCVLGWRSMRGRKNATRTWARRGAIVLLIGVMGLAPATVAYFEKATSNLAVYFVVDATGSMAAEDYNGNEQRLEGVRQDIIALVDAIPGARFSIIEFSSTSTTQLPLTTDRKAVLAWADVYDREVTAYSAGSDINRPVAELTEVLQRAEERYPDDVRVVYYFGDGESTNARDSSADAVPEFTGLADYIDAGFVLGYGTAEGGQMLKKDLFDGEVAGKYIEDPATAAPAISKMNEDALKTVAEQLGIEYEHRTAPGDVTQLAAAAQGTEETNENGEKPVYAPMIWPLAIAVTLLMVWELWELVPSIKAVGALTPRNTGPHPPASGVPQVKQSSNSGWLT